MKKVFGQYGNNKGHWVGDGFPVRSLFSYGKLGRKISLFLLLDYAGPHAFEPTSKPRGVGQHHRTKGVPSHRTDRLPATQGYEP
jgi:quercetin 2,3-dioxygenase